MRDLLGPAGGEEEEVVNKHVYERYLIGMLAPKDTQTLPEDQDNNDPLEEGAEDTGTLDSDNTQTISFTPSTMGMSFRVDPGATHIKVTVGWGHYQRVGSESLTNEKTGNPKPIWRRTPRGGSYLLPLRDGRSEPWHPEATEQPEVELRAIIRRTDACWMVSLFLING
ncbi:MAG TPA: hypothetical protein VHZ51_21990 [Ktedonobacteraceae bacterium]|nr:hypothetical protein [Ktedonobacteraceae bacterium]